MRPPGDVCTAWLDRALGGVSAKLELTELIAMDLVGSVCEPEQPGGGVHGRQSVRGESGPSLRTEVRTRGSSGQCLRRHATGIGSTARLGARAA